jgi:hypothetical protein
LPFSKTGSAFGLKQNRTIVVCFIAQGIIRCRESNGWRGEYKILFDRKGNLFLQTVCGVSANCSVLESLFPVILLWAINGKKSNLPFQATMPVGANGKLNPTLIWFSLMFIITSLEYN